MELLLELIFELVVEGVASASKDRKLSKWIRYPLAVLLILFIITVIGIIGVVGVMMLLQDGIDKFGGIIILAFDIVMIISAVKKIKNANL